MKKLIIVWIAFVSLMLTSPSFAGEHVVERGETALQIALDHDLTIEQLSKMNPDIDLEMMLIGDVLTVPDEGTSFEEYINSLYAEKISTSDINCEVLADQSVLCLFHAENLTDLPLYEVKFAADIRGQNGAAGHAEGSIPLMQILPGEKLPCSLTIPGRFDAVESYSISIQNLSQSEMVQSSFRVPETGFSETDTFLPDAVSAVSTILFNEDSRSDLNNKQINLLAAAYDTDGTLIGVRSLFSDFYPRLDITLFTNNHKINSIELRLEAY